LPAVKEAYEWVRDRGIFRDSQAAGFLIGTEELTEGIPEQLRYAPYVLSHQPINYISWPYEWCFYQLRDAALLHLDFQLFLLERDAVLSDASAYNVQFIGRRPVFIDALSIRPYREREYWTGYKQFCDQFLNPLLLRSLKGVAHNAWYRGALEGIAARDLSTLLSWRNKFSYNVLTHVVLQAQLEAKALNNPVAAINKARGGKGLSRLAYRGILEQLRGWIHNLQPRGYGRTVWGDYAENNTYLPDDVVRKSNAIQSFCGRHRPGMLFDLGCNTGFYSDLSLRHGAGYVVGFDFDQRAVERAHARLEHTNTFLPLWLDAANPSPDQGWQQAERDGFNRRARADALVALAFEHHLTIGKNVPLEQFVDWLVSLAPCGLVEFVPKGDSTVQDLLALREDIFPDYTREHFLAALGTKVRIVGCSEITESGRALIEYSA
jgi:ribosomal protein L11 methylase PrmA